MKISQTSTYYVLLPYLHRNVVHITTEALIETEQNLMLIERPTKVKKSRISLAFLLFLFFCSDSADPYLH